MLAVAMLVGMAAGTEAYAASKKRAKARTTATTKKSGLKGQIKASNGVVYSLKSNGRWTSGRRSGTWQKVGKLVRIGYDDADGGMFYYNGAIYDTGSDCGVDPYTLPIESYSGDDPGRLFDYKQCSAKLTWFK